MRFRESQTSTLERDERRNGLVVGLKSTADSTFYELANTERRWLLGSGESCDVVIHDPYVSDTHCVLERKAGGALVVRDRRSKNGTRVDGNFVEGAELRIGSHLLVGRTTLIAVPGAASSDEDSAIAKLRGSDVAFRATVEQALRVGRADCDALVVGETGTGKELIARAIHDASRRAAGPYVTVNCGAIPKELVASELFGHEKGAFTGALNERDGFFVQAHGGTLFLDEIGELPIDMQPHLLRVLESRRVRRVGGSQERSVDVRIIAATNRMEGLGTESSRLRLDLYHRIATVVLKLPALRERKGDVIELIEYMVARSASTYGRKRISEEAWNVLRHYHWPGNVRELMHAVSRAVALGGEELGPADFFPPHQRAVTPLLPGGMLADGSIVDDDTPYESTMRQTLAFALDKHGSIRAAAEFLGIPKSTFADRAKQYGLSPRKKGRNRG